MNIKEALPEVFDRAIPVLAPDTQILLAISQLLFHEVDALPVGLKPRQQKRRTFFGYSCLDELLQTQPDEYEKFLDSPCVNAARDLARIKADDDIETLLHVFQKTGLGYTWVESKTESGFASLLDSLKLYTKGLIDSEMTVGETASPIFSLPGETKIDVALEEMFNRKFGRVFVGGGGKSSID